MNKKIFVEEFMVAIDSKDISEVRVGVSMPTLPELEYIHNPKENLEGKLEYYNKAYNEDMELEVFNGIKIVSIEALHPEGEF